MGLFDRFKNKVKDTSNDNNDEINAIGWDAITEECERVYPNQKNPKHYGTIIGWQFGGKDPLEGISIYDGGSYWHFVTYGLSELYDKQSDNKDVSGYGMEFTFKLKKGNYENEEAEIKCICGILQAIARNTFTKGEIFKPYEYVYTGQTQGIDTKMASNITGFITIPDNDLKTIMTPNGKVEFVEFIGATNDELLAIMNKDMDVKTLYEKIGSDITDYNRKSVFITNNQESNQNIDLDKKQFFNWLDNILKNDLPSHIKAINFNLYDDGEGKWSIEFVGASYFDEKDDDWACSEVFTTRTNPYVLIKDSNWKYIEGLFMTFLQQYLDYGNYSNKLKNYLAIGFGFVDGDLTVIYKK